MSFLIPNVFVLLVFNLIFLFFLTIASSVSIRIIRRWSYDSTSEEQYDLERKSRLITVIVKYIAVLKIPLFFIFIYASGKMAEVLPGAMCAAGAVNATPYGQFLVYCTLLNIYLLSVWLIINYYDSKSETMPFTILKAKLTLAALAVMAAETVLFVLNFTLVDPAMPVSCCNVIYADNNTHLPSEWVSAALFTAVYAVMLIAYKLRRTGLYSAFNVIFFFVSVIAMIQFTGIYVYQMPTHKCPFCMLDDAYEQVGYFFYAFLFLGTVSGIGMYVMNLLTGENKKYLLRTSIFFNTLYFLLSVYYPLKYYIINHTWL